MKAHVGVFIIASMQDQATIEAYLSLPCFGWNVEAIPVPEAMEASLPSPAAEESDEEASHGQQQHTYFCHVCRCKSDAAMADMGVRVAEFVGQHPDSTPSYETRSTR